MQKCPRHVFSTASQALGGKRSETVRAGNLDVESLEEAIDDGPDHRHVGHGSGAYVQRCSVDEHSRAMPHRTYRFRG